MVDVPLSRGDWFRSVAEEARIILRNRLFEQNPSLTTQQVALLARMGLKRLVYIGDGPVRGEYSQSGVFSDALFIVSGDAVFRVETDLTHTQIFSGLTSGNETFVQFAATSNIGDTPAYLFFADGSVLYCYIENGYAHNTISGTPANNDVVRLDTVYYKFTNGSVNAGSPAGTNANPWLVALGAGASEAWQNFYDAIGATGVAGTQYSTALTKHTTVQSQTLSTTAVSVRALLVGALGNAIIATETGAGIAWADTSGFLVGGGAAYVTQVNTPDDVGILSVGYIGGYVICVPTQGQNINGRFFWIEPGETTIDPLNFATAERAPDPTFGVIVFGDNFWLPGSTTTEVWYLTGDINAPVLRLRGVAFERGTWEGTAVQVKDSMIIPDNDGRVFQISGGLKEISNPAVTQRIREAMEFQAFKSSI